MMINKKQIKLGIDSYSLRIDAIEVLNQAHKFGLDGVHFSTTDQFSDFSQSYVQKVKEKAQSLNLHIEIGMGSCNPFSECRASHEKNKSHLNVLKEHIFLAHQLEANIVRTFFGFTKERFNKDVPFKTQIDATIKNLKEATKLAEKNNVFIALENHMDLTSAELIKLITEVDSPNFAICFDTANQLMLLEDPLDALKNLISYIRSVHLKDALLFPSDNGADFIVATIGEGIVPLKKIINLLINSGYQGNLNIEDHEYIFPIPFKNNDFISAYQHITEEKINHFKGLIEHCLKLIPKDFSIEVYKTLTDSAWNNVITQRLGKDIHNAKTLLSEIYGM